MPSPLPLKTLQRQPQQANSPQMGQLDLLDPQQAQEIEQRLQGRPMLPYSYGSLDDQTPSVPKPPLPPGLSGERYDTGRRNPRTGQAMYATDDADFLTAPVTEGIPQMASGAYDVAHAPNFDARMAGASELTRGAMKAGMPLMAAGAVTAPLATGLGLAYGSAVGGGTEAALGAAGVKPGTAAFLGDLAGLGAGGYASRFARDVPQFTGRLRELLSSEEGTQALAPKKPSRWEPIGAGLALTGENVLGVAKRLLGNRAEKIKPEGVSYGDWVKKNPEAGGELFDLANAERAGVYPEGPIERKVPKEIPDRIVAAFRKPTVIRQLQEWVDAGMQKMPEPWYRTGPLYEVFEKEWGPEEAPAQMKKLLQYIAATSTSAKVPDNLKIASVYNYMDQQGIPFPEKPPPGYGHKFQGSHRDAAVDFREGTFDPVAKPKRASYVNNLGGNEYPVTADRHFYRAVGMASKDPRFLKTRFEDESVKPPLIRNIQQEYNDGLITMKQAQKNPQWWDEAPEDDEYAYAEDAFRRKVAEPKGLSAGQGQEKMWVGAGDTTGLGSPGEPILRTLGRRIAYTAHQMGVTPDEVLSAFVRGKIPLLEFGAAALGLQNLATQPDSEPEDPYRRRE